MSRSSLFSKSDESRDAEIFSKRSALVSFWLLCRSSNEAFSINEVARELDLSPGTAHRVVTALEYEGIVHAHGFRTKKRFTLVKPKNLLIAWLKSYHFRKKVKTRQFAVTDRQVLTNKRLKMDSELTPALHTAAREIFRARATNLSTLELYLPHWSSIDSIARGLGLIEQERGYEVLILQPYYPVVVERFKNSSTPEFWREAFAILTFLDLYGFPLRGREAAETMFRRTKVLSRICTWSEIEKIE